MSMKQIKCVVVGDGYVGKRSMLMCYAMGVFPDDYEPTILAEYSAKVLVDDTPIVLSLWDTAGQDDYDRLRPLIYPDTDVIFVCFSLINRASFQNVSLKWIKEIQNHAPNVPVVLVGTKLDMRKGVTSDNVTYEQGFDLAKTIKAKKYFECSAKTREGLKQVFEETTKQVLAPVALSEPFHCQIL